MTSQSHADLKLRAEELAAAIEDLCLGSVTPAVIEAAVAALNKNWDDHNKESDYK